MPLPDSAYPAAPAGRRRIADLCAGRPATIAGRMIDVAEGSGRLADESGEISVRFAGRPPRAGCGDLIEIHGTWNPPEFRADRVRLLAPKLTDGRDHVAGLRTALTLRAGVLSAIRSHFDGQGFLEVETPSLVPCPGMEPHLTAFRTDAAHAGPPGRLYLPTSPEYAMKRLLSAGFERIYQVCRAFRDEPPSRMHNPEFTLLEWYRAYANHHAIMSDAERLVHHIALVVGGTPILRFAGQEVDTTPPWHRITVGEAFQRHAGVDLGPDEDAAEMVARARKAGNRSVADDDSYQDAFYKVFLDSVEPRLGAGRPVLLTDYPASMAALARVREDSPRVAERFEIYIAGVELANGFHELNDPVEQRRRLESEAQQRVAHGGESYPVDDRFLDALRRGMPPSGGVALGVDRLVMLLAGQQDIRNVLAFPFPKL